MEREKKYFAFISYSHKDSEMAKWLQHEFEYYELPAKLFDERKDLRRDDLPKSFRPIFRDEDELAGGELKPQISEALADSEYLVVVCSPNSAQSLYVDSEIKEFISLSHENKRRVFPFIVDGKPHQDDEHKEKECFPKTLLKLSDDKTDPIELIAGDIDIHEKGRDHAFVKVLAGTLKEKGIQFADLWDRYAIEKAEKERKEREDKEKLQIAQSRFLAGKANQLVDEGDSYTARLLALKALPKDTKNPDRPYVPEAEYVLRLAATQNTAILKGHKSVVKEVVFSPDGEWVLSASDDDTIRLWSVVNGMCIKAWNSSADIVSFLPDNHDRFVSARSTGIEKLRIWNVKKDVPIGNKQIKNYADKLCFSYSGDSLFTIINSELQIWKTESGEIWKKIKKDEFSDIRSMAVSPDGKKVACGLKNCLIKILDIEKEDFIVTLKGHKDSVNSLTFDINGKLLASSSWTTILLWDVAKAESNVGVYGIYDKYTIISESGNNNRILSFGPDGETILSTSMDKSIKIWDIDTKEYKTLCGHLYEINSAKYNQKNNLIVSASSDKMIRLWDNYIIPDFKTIPLLLKMNVGEASFSPDRASLATTNGKNVYLWNTSTGECKRIIEGNEKQINSIDFSPDGKMLITTSLDHTVRVWDIQSKNCCIIDNSNDSVMLPVFNNNGTFFATSSDVLPDTDKSVIKLWSVDTLWDVVHNAPIETIECDIPIATALFAPNEDKLIAIDAFGNYREWGILKNNEFRFSPIKIYDGKTIEGKMEISPNGELICFSSGSYYDPNIYMWNRKNKKLITFVGHKGGVLSVSFSSSGNLLVSASNDKTVKIWDVATTTCLKTFYGHTNEVKKAVFSKDDKYVISISNDNTIIWWDFPSLQELINATRDRFKDRELTPEEKKNYYLE